MKASPGQVGRGWPRKWVLLLVTLVVIGGLLYRSRGAIGLQDFSWTSLWQSVRNANPWLLLLSLAAIYFVYAVRALRWVRFSRYLGKLHFWDCYGYTLAGFASVFLLGRIGEPVRPLLIARKERVSVSAMFGIYVLERLFDASSTVVLAGLALLLVPPHVFSEQAGRWLASARTAGVILLVGVTAAAAFLIYFRLHGARALDRRLARWRAHHGWRARVAGLFAGFSEGLQSIRTVGDLTAAVSYSAVHWGIVACVYLWIPWSFGGRLGELTPSAALLVLGFTMVGSTLQLPGVGGGSQVASFLALTLFFGVEKEPAAAVSIVLWLITFAGSTLAGVPVLVREGWSMGELRRMARAEAAAEAAGTHLKETPEPQHPGAHAQ